MERVEMFSCTPGETEPGVVLSSATMSILVAPEDFHGLFMLMTTHMSDLNFECVRIALAQHDARKRKI